MAWKLDLNRYCERHRFPVGVLGGAYILGIAFLDYATGTEVSLTVFYLPAIALFSWYYSRPYGISAAILSTLLWFYGDFLGGRWSAHPAIAYWDGSALLGFFLAFSMTLQNLRLRFKKQQELMITTQRVSAEIQKIADMQSQFVSTVSHELKNPLGVIRESMSLILDKLAGEVSGEQRKILEMGKNSAERLIRLVGDLLDLSKIEAGKMKLRPEDMDLGILVTDVLKIYANEISKKRIVLQKEIPPNIGLLWGDRDALIRVVINLVNNAIKYTPEGGCITIKLTGSAREVRCEIADTGPGIPKESFAKLFNKFERVMVERQEGTGLGLAISKDIIELHKGKIWVESEAGKGSKFVFILPRS
jgi:signal transduction histidine kinase